ncbi:MAG: hypothetical protein NVSMB33_00410 [Ktedonobacteraceae bacterium]
MGDWNDNRIQARFIMLKETLRNTPAYQRILPEGLEKGLQLLINASESKEQN